MDNNGNQLQQNHAQRQKDVEEARVASARIRYRMTADESLALHDQFMYHAPKPDQIPRYHSLRERAYTLAVWIMECVPPSAERDASLLLVQQAVMMANAGIARHE